jgi:hypothetical protein
MANRQGVSELDVHSLVEVGRQAVYRGRIPSQALVTFVPTSVDLAAIREIDCQDGNLLDSSERMMISSTDTSVQSAQNSLGIQTLLDVGPAFYRVHGFAS